MPVKGLIYLELLLRFESQICFCLQVKEAAKTSEGLGKSHSQALGR